MYEMWFGDTLLPVTPGKISLETSNQNKTVELINEGEVNVLKSPGLSEISFDLLLPNVQYPFALYPETGFRAAKYYLDIFEKYKTKKEPFQFILSRKKPNGEVISYTNITVSLEDYTIDDDADESMDNIVSIDLKQYVSYGTKIVKVTKKKGKKKKKKTTKSRSAGKKSKTSGKTYEIREKDTLWNIAKKKLGSGAKWASIYNKNKTVIEKAAKKRGRASSSNGHWIYPGTKIILP